MTVTALFSLSKVELSVWEGWSDGYPASGWRVISGHSMMIRACLSLLIPTVMKDLVSTQVFRHAV
jgi:hypothetical protein